MPQATDEQRDEWHHGEEGGGDTLVIQFLQAAGYRLRGDWTWDHPDHAPTEKELSAIYFLVDEWDFGGLSGNPAGHDDTDRQ